MKKDAKKSADKLNALKQKDAKAAAQERAVEVPEVATRSRTNGSGKKGMALANTTFAKATDVEEDEEEYEEEEVAEVEEEEEAYEAAPAQESVSKGSKKETKEAKAKSKKEQKRDEMQLLADEAAVAKKQRIKDRLLNAFMIGIVMDAMKPKNGNSNGSQAAPKKKAKKTSDDDSALSMKGVREKINVFQGPFMMFVVIAAVIYGKAMEDSYSGGFEYDSVDFYGVMGLPRDASIIDVRKKYKALAISWHPDKNPGCATCEEKFAAISKAYNVLSDPEQKKDYDNQRSSKGAQSSAASVELTSEDFEAKVLRSNEVWVVQVYDPSEGPSAGFHPIWEENAAQYQHVANFGRLDASKQKAALNLLPQRIVIKPVIFRFAQGHSAEDYLWTGEESGYGSASAPLSRFILDTYPGMHHMKDVSDIQTWWQGSGRPRLLIAGSGSVIDRGAHNKQFLPVLRMAHLWSEFFEIGAADNTLVQKALQQQAIKLPGGDKKNNQKSWSVLWMSADSKVEVKSVEDLKELPARIEEVVQEAMASQAPQLTLRNHRQLCGAGAASRTFCLVLVDMTDESKVSQVLADLASSHAAYTKEVQEMKDADQEVTEEPFRIQVVRVSTSTARLPSRPVAVAPAFYSTWAEVNKASMFMVELETQRVTEVKASVLKDVCQQVAYEDLKFKELPEGISFVRGLPDPEAPLSREFFRYLTTPIGALVAYVLLAVILAVGPELRLQEKIGAAGGVLVFIFLMSPFACRRVLELVM